MLNLLSAYTTSPLFASAKELLQAGENTSAGMFKRILHDLGSNYQAQTYYSLLTYLLLATLICALLAALAYLFSLSATQDSEKRGEYECGFEPFDSATRLPFDVHFYLVGILFLIFDVEIALLLPWTLSLRLCGWFGFYLVVGFIAILGVGFLYEWKRGALIWPARQQEIRYSGFVLLGVATLPVDIANAIAATDSAVAGQLFPLYPELFLGAALTALLTYIAYLLHKNADKKSIALLSLNISYYILTILVVLYITQLVTAGGSVTVLNGYFAVNLYIVAAKLLVTLSALLVLVNSKLYIEEHAQHHLEYAVVLLLAILLMVLLVGANHLFSAFLALVGFSLNLYVLIMFDATNASAREAGIKYYYLSTFSSGLLLYGLFLLYTLTGQGQFDLINLALATDATILSENTPRLKFAVIFILFGLFFKLSAFPAHFWAAEVYDGSPSPVTTFFMVPVKVAVLGFVIQLFVVALPSAAPYWQFLVGLAAIGSMIWGALGALFEKRTKRFFAYASINQIGFILVGLATASAAGYQATFMYILIYVLMNVIVIALFLQARRSDGRHLLYLTDFRGLARVNWLYSWALAITLFSMAGIPPLAGFFGKYYLLLQATEQGLYLLVVIGLATSLVSTYYYLRLVKILWFEGDVGVSGLRCAPTAGTQSLIFFTEAVLCTPFIFLSFVLAGAADLDTSLNSALLGFGLVNSLSPKSVTRLNSSVKINQTCKRGEGNTAASPATKKITDAAVISDLPVIPEVNRSAQAGKPATTFRGKLSDVISSAKTIAALTIKIFMIVLAVYVPIVFIVVYSPIYMYTAFAAVKGVAYYRYVNELAAARLEKNSITPGKDSSENGGDPKPPEGPTGTEVSSESANSKTESTTDNDLTVDIFTSQRDAADVVQALAETYETWSLAGSGALVGACTISFFGLVLLKGLTRTPHETQPIVKSGYFELLICTQLAFCSYQVLCLVYQMYLLDSINGKKLPNFLSRRQALIVIPLLACAALLALGWTIYLDAYNTGWEDALTGRPLHWLDPDYVEPANSTLLSRYTLYFLSFFLIAVVAGRYALRVKYNQLFALMFPGYVQRKEPSIVARLKEIYETNWRLGLGMGIVFLTGFTLSMTFAGSYQLVYEVSYKLFEWFCSWF